MRFISSSRAIFLFMEYPFLAVRIYIDIILYHNIGEATSLILISQLPKTGGVFVAKNHKSDLFPSVFGKNKSIQIPLTVLYCLAMWGNFPVLLLLTEVTALVLRHSYFNILHTSAEMGHNPQQAAVGMTAGLWRWDVFGCCAEKSAFLCPVIPDQKGNFI